MRVEIFCSLVLCLALGFPCEAAEPIFESSQTDTAITWHRIEKLKSLGPICFRLPEFANNSFRLVFPEWITAREMNWHVKPEWVTKGSNATGTWKSGRYALHLQLKYSRQETTRTLAWEYQFRNDSDSSLTDVAAFNCLTLVDAPAFLDLSMQRSWVGQDKASRVTLSTVKKTKGSRTMQFYGAKGGLKITEFERFMRYGVTSTQQLAGDRIGVNSRNGKWTLESIVEGRVAFFFNNWEPTHGCIHAAPILGDIAAGKTGSARGRIVFTQMKSQE